MREAIKSNLPPYRLTDNEISLLGRVKNVFKINGFYSEMLPEIYFCDFNDADNVFNIDRGDVIDEKNHYYNPDYLGKYMYSASKEGSIIIYRDRIHEAAHRLSSQFPPGNFKSHNEIVILLKAKVLIHEIGHWITHSCSLRNKQDVMMNYGFLPKLIKESLAQLTVCWSFADHQNVFDFELDNFSRLFMPMQPKPYYEFRHIKHIDSPHIIIKRYWGIVSVHTHLNESKLFDLLCKNEVDLSATERTILSGQQI